MYRWVLVSASLIKHGLSSVCLLATVELVCEELKITQREHTWLRSSPRPHMMDGIRPLLLVGMKLWLTSVPFQVLSLRRNMILLWKSNETSQSW